MSENIKELTDLNFDKEVSKGNWVVDFWAEWCGPCRMMAPHFEAAAKSMKGKINFAKVNVEENMQTAEQFGIMSIPTIIFFKEGEILDKVSGAMSKDSIINHADSTF